MEVSTAESKRKTGEAGKDGVGAALPFMEFVLVPKNSAEPCSLLRLPTPPPPTRSLRRDGLSSSGVSPLLGLQRHWLTTPLERVNRGSSSLTSIPQTSWGTSFSQLGEHPTEGLDVT